MARIYTVLIENLVVKTIIGILDKERISKQRVRIDAKISYKDSFIDYAIVAKQIEKSLIKGKFGLLEEALDQITKDIKSSFKEVLKIKISLKKLDILDNCIVGVESKKTYKDKNQKNKEQI